MVAELIAHPLNKVISIVAIWVVIIATPIVIFFCGDFYGYKRAVIARPPTNTYTAPVYQTYKKGYRFVGLNLGLVSVGHIVEEK